MATDDLLKELLGQGQKKQIDPLQYLRIIWRKKHLLLIPLAVSWVIAAVGVNFSPVPCATVMNAPLVIAVSSLSVSVPFVIAVTLK